MNDFEIKRLYAALLTDKLNRMMPYELSAQSTIIQRHITIDDVFKDDISDIKFYYNIICKERIKNGTI